MKKIYDVNQLLKPVRLYEQDSDATQAEDVDKKDEEEKGQEEKKDENDQKNNDGQENKEDEKNEGDKQADGNADQNNNPEQAEQKADDKGNVQAQQNALNNVSKSLMDCSVELDNIYKNNNLKKYGMGVENAYKGVMRFVWPAIGITVAATVAFLCMQGIIPAKKVLSKVPLIGKLFQGDKAAINSVQQSLLFAGTNKATQMGTQAINNIGNKSQQAQTVGNSTVAPETQAQPATEPSAEQGSSTNTENANVQNGVPSTTTPEGSNSEQKTDKAPTIENSVEAQSKAKPGDVIQRKNGEKYVLNQGDINWAKQQVQKGKGNETVDQAKQEDTGNVQQTVNQTQNDNANPQVNEPTINNEQTNTNQQGESINGVAQQAADKDNSQEQQTPQETSNQSQSIKQTAQEVEKATQNGQDPVQNTNQDGTDNKQQSQNQQNLEQNFTIDDVKVTGDSSMGEGWKTNTIKNSQGLAAGGITSNLTSDLSNARTWIGLYDSKNQLHTLMYNNGKLQDTNGRLVGLSKGANQQLMNSARTNFQKGITLEKFMGA